MHQKPKRRTANPFRYWLNEFLFVRHFEHESELSLTEFEDNLRALAHEPQSDWWLWEISQVVEIQPVDSRHFTFIVQSRRRGRGEYRPFTSALMQGRVAYDASTRKTSITGRTRFGLFYHGVIILAMVTTIIAVTQFASLASWWLPALFVLSLGIVTWRKLYQDRNTLLRGLKRALSPRQNNIARLEIKPSIAPANSLADEPQQKQRYR